jgi:transposase
MDGTQDPRAADYRLFVGVDIAAATAMAAWQAPGGKVSRPVQIAPTPQGRTDLHEKLGATGVPAAQTLVVMEATGSYWITLATTLAQGGYAVAVINPSQAHDFAKALLKRAKTDAIDAQTLAQLAALLQPERWTPPPAIYTELQQRLAQRDSLLDLRHQVTNQLHALEHGPVVIAAVRQRMETLIATLNAQIKEVEKEITPVLAQDETWAKAAALLQTITGVGLVTAAWLVTTTLNFRLCPSPEAAAAYAGLVPYVRESGTSVRGKQAISRSGNKRLRRTLYLATLAATRWNPQIKAFYQRLRAAGKPPKVARCAAARKLLHLAWAVVTKGRAYDPAYQCGSVTPPSTAA